MPSPTRHGCVCCDTWQPISQFRSLAPGLWSPLCLQCEAVRRPPTRFERVETDPEMERLAREPDYGTLCREAMLSRPDLCTLHWEGGAGLRGLLGLAMRASNGAANPSRVSEELLLRLNSWPQIRLVEDDLWGVYDWGTESWLSTHDDPFDAEKAWTDEINRRKLLSSPVPSELS